MTVAELIKELQTYPENAQVVTEDYANVTVPITIYNLVLEDYHEKDESLPAQLGDTVIMISYEGEPT